MKVRVIGGGWYGCHVTRELLRYFAEPYTPWGEFFSVELHEQADRLFDGASGSNPARLHAGFHYPRSEETRSACRSHANRFMSTYGELTRAVPVNLYAIAEGESLVDFGTYRRVLKGDVEFVTIRPQDFGLANVEGALLTGERHIVIDEARAYFESALGDVVHYGVPYDPASDGWDLTVDCTFASLDATDVDRYEPCLVPLLRGPTDRAVTIMDGPLPSLYPWNEDKGLCSLSSAKFTPLAKSCRTYAEAQAMLAETSIARLRDRAEQMFDQLCHFYPGARAAYDIVDLKISIRAMPKSGADARLCRVRDVGGGVLRVQPGKIDAIFRAADLVLEKVAEMAQQARAA